MLIPVQKAQFTATVNYSSVKWTDDQVLQKEHGSETSLSIKIKYFNVQR